MDLAGKRIVITGGASGIGWAMAQAFGAAGGRLLLVDLDATRLDQAVARLGRAGTEAAGAVVDVTDRTAMLGLAADAVEIMGGVDVVCNNAGVATWGPIATATPADWEFTMGVNFWGVVHGIEAFLPHLLSQGSGHIVNTASMAGLAGMEYLGVYCASKFAVVGLSEALARELKPAGIGVSLLCPMVVDTPINEHSSTMRPKHLRNPDAPAAPDGLAGSVIAPEAVAARVVDAVESGAFYVLTHPEQREILRRRSARLDDAAARAGG